MAELLKQQHNLVVLELSLDRLSKSASSFGSTVFKLEVSGTSLFEIKTDSKEMGLPNNLREAREYRYNEPIYTIPEIVMQELQKRLPGVLDPGIPLWLQLANDCGILPLVPWERLLQPRLGVPILRLPYFAIKPFSPTSSSLDIILCASTPVAKEPIPVEILLDTLTRRLLETVQRDSVIIHVFADAFVYNNLQSFLRDRLALTNGKGVRLYNPADAATYAPTSSSGSIRETPGHLENPWLLWMIDSLRGHSVDAIHFICHGYLSADLGSLAFATTPTHNEDRRWALFVGAQQLMTFSTYVGASSVGFSSPERNYSELGLRLLADQLARLRPGPVLLQEVRGDPGCQTLAEVYSFLNDEMRDMPPSSSALALYCHPSRVKQIAQQPGDINQESILNQYTLAKGETLKIMESKENTPSWVASSQRYLEQSVAELIETEPTSSSSEPSATRQGVEEALSFLSDTLVRHAPAESDVKGKEPLQ